MNRPIGGIGALAAYLKNSTKGFENNTIITFMGDQVGASIPASGLLNHEPTILSLNTLANSFCSFDNLLSMKCNMVATIGNHEFDKGRIALNDLVYGTNKPPIHSWISLPKYPGAIFPYISANIVDEETNQPLFPPYLIKNINGIRIAFIGAILKNAGSSILPENTKGIKFLDEATTINHYLNEIKKLGIKTTIVIIHQGGDSEIYEGDTRPNTHVNGEIKEVISKLDDGVEVVMAGHTHRFLNAYLPNKNGRAVLVTQANSYSDAFAEVTLKINQANNNIIKKSAKIVSTFSDKPPGSIPDANATMIVKAAEESVAPIVNQHIGTLSDNLTRTTTNAGESSLGNLIADAFRSVMHTDIGMTNSSSIRNDLKAGDVTWGSLYSIQPFENPIVKITLNGKEILELLEQQWKVEYKNILQVSGLTYSYNESMPVDHHINAAFIHGQPIDPAKQYTIAVSTFLANGGSGFTVFKKGKVIETRGTDLEDLIMYIKSLPQPFTAKIENRIMVAQ